MQDHIGLISWSLIDKGLYILYGFVLIVIMNRTDLPEFGLYSLLIGLHTWIFTISDSFALQSLIQFGMNEKNRSKVNLIAMLTHLSLTLGVALVLFLLRVPLSHLFNEPRIEDIAAFLPILTLAFIPRTFCQKIIYRIQNMFYLFLTNLLFFGVITIFVLIGISNGGRLNFGTLSYYYLYGSIASSIMALILTYKHISFSRTGEIGWRKIYNFGWQMTSVSLLFTLPRQLDIFIVKLFFPLETIGLYSAAKNIFRVFDEAMAAINSLIYPSAVKHLNNKNKIELNSLITKSFSFGFILFSSIFLILIFGISDIVFNLILPKSYLSSLKYFNILIFSAPFLPFTFIYSVLVAMNRMKEIVIMIGSSLVCFFVILYFIGINNFQQMIPIGIVTYYILIGITGLIYSKIKLEIPIKSIFRVFNDMKYFIMNRRINLSSAKQNPDKLDNQDDNI